MSRRLAPSIRQIELNTFESGTSTISLKEVDVNIKKVTSADQLLKSNIVLNDLVPAILKNGEVIVSTKSVSISHITL